LLKNSVADVFRPVAAAVPFQQVLDICYDAHPSVIKMGWFSHHPDFSNKIGGFRSFTNTHTNG